MLRIAPIDFVMGGCANGNSVNKKASYKLSVYGKLSHYDQQR